MLTGNLMEASSAIHRDEGRSGDVFFFQPFLPHYRIEPWRRLNEALDGKLVVIYGGPEPQNQYTEQNDFGFRVIRVPNYGFLDGTLTFQPFWQPFRWLGRPSVVVTSQNPRIVSLFPLFVYCRLRRIPIVLRGHGGSRRRPVTTSRAPADLVHRWFVRQADAFICYTDQSRDELATITDPGKLFAASNTIDMDKISFIRRSLEAESQLAVRRRLGLMDSDFYVSFIGLLTRSKRVDLLLEMTKRLQSDGHRIGLVIVGDGPERARLESMARYLGLGDTHFLGQMTDWAKSGEYLFASDVMVIPGYVGLAVNHSLGMGVPVVTSRQGTNGPFHSPEVAYLSHSITGYFADPFDVDSLGQCVLRAIKRREQFRRNVIDYAEANLTLAPMIQGHVDAIRFARGW